MRKVTVHTPTRIEVIHWSKCEHQWAYRESGRRFVRVRFCPRCKLHESEYVGGKR